MASASAAVARRKVMRTANQLRVTIPSTEVRQGDRTYTAYCLRVHTSVAEWTVVRRYSDFAELLTTLRHEHADLAPLPHMPRKTWVGRMRESVVTARQVAFRAILHALLLEPRIAACETMRKFLDMHEHVDGNRLDALTAERPLPRAFGLPVVEMADVEDVLLVVATGGAARRASATVRELLEKQGVAVTTEVVEGKGRHVVEEKLAHVETEHMDAVVLVGDDVFFSQAMNGMMQRAGSKLPVALMHPSPHSSAFMRELECDTLAKAVARVVSGRTHHIRAGQLRFGSGSGMIAFHYVCLGTDPSESAGAKALGPLHLDLHECKLRHDREEESMVYKMVYIPFLNRLEHPHGDSQFFLSEGLIDSDVLDVIGAGPDASGLEMRRMFQAGLYAVPDDPNEFSRQTLREYYIEPKYSSGLHVDGQFVGTTPLSVSVLPHALSFFV